MVDVTVAASTVGVFVPFVPPKEVPLMSLDHDGVRCHHRATVTSHIALADGCRDSVIRHSIYEGDIG